MVYLLLVVGLVLLIVGGDALVRGSVGVARKLGLSPFFIGAVLVGFGTSAPEMVTSISAALAGSPGLAVGNVVGSNISNIGLILGVAALVAVLGVERAAIRRDLIAMGAATILTVALLQLGTLTLPIGLMFLAALAVYIGSSFVLDRRNMAAAALHEAEEQEIEPANLAMPLAILFTIGGLIAVLIGARLLVSSAIEIARDLGVSETVIGLTVVAVGTSLPELAASVAAALKRHGAVAIGNVVGSNIFNLLGILGVTALVKPIPVPLEIARFDVWLMAAATLALSALLWWRGKLDRITGVVFLGGYIAYVATLLLSHPGG